MKSTEIKEKLDKALEAVTKKEATLEKYYKKVEKIKKQIVAKGWDVEAGKYQKQGTDEHHDCYWMFCDLRDAEEGIERTTKAIAEKKGVAAKWEVRLQEAQEKEKLIDSKFPEIFKSFQQEVIKAWDEWDLNYQKRLHKEYKKMKDEDTSRNKMDSYEAFIKKYTYTVYEFMMYTTEEEIHRDNVRTSERLVLNLWNRVKEIVGEATDWSGLYLTNGNSWEGVAINGIVTGTTGSARVDTIGAGGYNIQRFHYRTLVHKI